MQPILPVQLRRIALARLLAACGVAACGVAACGDRRGARRSDVPAAASSSASAASAPKDSLALRTFGGTELWFTLAREEQDSAGASCIERGLEIRNGAGKLPVPLLYTRDVPRLVNESTVSTRIWNRCAPGDEYRINLKTGQPFRARR
jgi:hypothetical protein